VLAAVCQAAGAPVIVETPAAGQAEDIAFLRSRLGHDAGRDA
jgi:deoxyribonuclease-4